MAASDESKNGDLLTLLSRAISALRQSAVDDLHPAGHYAQLLDRLAHITKEHSRGSSGELPDLGNTTLPDDNRHVEQPRNGAGPVYNDLPVPSISMNFPDDWDDWLAFQFDPALAPVGDMEFDQHLPYSDAFGVVPGTDP